MQFQRNNRQDRDNETAVPIIEPSSPVDTLFPRRPASTWNYDPAIYARSLSPRGKKVSLPLSLWKASDNAYCSEKKEGYTEE